MVVVKVINNRVANLLPQTGRERLHHCCPLVNKIENVNGGQVWARPPKCQFQCGGISPWWSPSNTRFIGPYTPQPTCTSIDSCAFVGFTVVCDQHRQTYRQFYNSNNRPHFMLHIVMQRNNSTNNRQYHNVTSPCSASYILQYGTACIRPLLWRGCSPPAVQQLIDISCSPGPQQLQQCVATGWDRQTDRRKTVSQILIRITTRAVPTITG